MMHLVPNLYKSTCRLGAQQQAPASSVHSTSPGFTTHRLARSRFSLASRRLAPFAVGPSTAVWKANLQRIPGSGFKSTPSCLTLWTRLAAIFRTGNESAIYKALLGLSSLAPEHLRNNNLSQDSQRQPNSSFSTHYTATKQATSAHDLQSATLAVILMCPEERSAREEILLRLVSLLESTSGEQKLLLAASLYSCLSSSQASLPPGALTARHLTTFVSSLSSIPGSSSAGSALIPPSSSASLSHASSCLSTQSTDLYLLATLQCILASASYHRHGLISALAVPHVMQLLQSEQEMHCNALGSPNGVSTELQHLLISAESGDESSGPVTEAALAVLSQLAISGTAVESEVVNQMLEAHALPVLINMLACHSRSAAGLLCILAKEQQCKEAFLDQSALKSLVHCLSGDAAIAKEAAGVLWRVAADCDKAKLEVAKAGAVGPAVAMLQAGDRNAASIASATEAAYLLAEIAEHPCTHQLIIQHGSLAAILRIMHATCQACTAARTLDSVTAKQLSHSTQLSEAVTCDANAFKGNSSSFVTGEPSLDVFRSPVDQAQSAVSDVTGDFGRLSTSPSQHTGRKPTEESFCDVQAEPEHTLEDLRKEHPNSAAEVADSASASGNALSNDVSRTDSGDLTSSGAKSVNQASGAFGLSDMASNAADAASTAVPWSMANRGSSSSDSAGAVMGGLRSPSDGIMAEQADLSMHSSNTSSNNAWLAANGEGHNSSSSTGTVGGDSAVFGGVASSSIHSRLLQAAQAAAHTEAACSSGRKADTSPGPQGCSGQSTDSTDSTGLLRNRLLVAANAALVSLTGNPDTHFGLVNEGAAPALVATLQYGTVNSQALACNSMHAIAASDLRHAAVFARAGAIPWLVGLLHQWPCHPCGRNAALTLKEMLQNPDYQSEACACGTIPALVVMLKGSDADCQASAASLLHTLAAATHISRKKAISRGGGIPALVDVLAGASAEGSMHAAQSLLHMAKLPELKVALLVSWAALYNAWLLMHLTSKEMIGLNNA
ncbi:TPA: hypothetical protein ACH3X1_009624 [Trebouxia sp. C0004]